MASAGRPGHGAWSPLGHQYSAFVFDDPNFERREYDPWAAYGQSKTAVIEAVVESEAEKVWP
jgi:hypothetical protein